MSIYIGANTKQQTFEEWRDSTGCTFDEQEFRSLAMASWNAALKSACDQFEECEGTDYGVLEDYTAT